MDSGGTLFERDALKQEYWKLVGVPTGANMLKASLVMEMRHGEAFTAYRNNHPMEFV